MKTWLMALLMVGLAATWLPTTSHAKRLGGGKPAGMQRTAPDKAAPSAPATPAATPGTPAATPNTPGTPAAAAAPATTGTAAATASPKRSWLGPVAGLAAGLGLAALFSHLGLGEGFADVMMLALLAVMAVVVIRMLMRRFAGGTANTTPFALAGAGAGSSSMSAPPVQRSALNPPLAAPQITASERTLPADFDAAAFQRIAKMIFIRLQAANDRADLNDLRAFTTPELFASLRVDLQERGSAAQQTDVMTLDTELLDFAQDNDLQIVSVRFHGLMREEAQAAAAPFDEVWHLVRPLDGSRSWAIAGIQPREVLAAA
jgi:predicted lipid-binding transport protein (Tim44 family)